MTINVIYLLCYKCVLLYLGVQGKCAMFWVQRKCHIWFRLHKDTSQTIGQVRWVQIPMIQKSTESSKWNLLCFTRFILNSICMFMSIRQDSYMASETTLFSVFVLYGQTIFFFLYPSSITFIISSLFLPCWLKRIPFFLLEFIII